MDTQADRLNENGVLNFKDYLTISYFEWFKHDSID
jgi:hypothetical protein